MLSRALVLLCVASSIVLSEAPGAGVSAEQVSSLRQLEEEVVKVHVKLHQKEAASPPENAAPAKKHARKHHKKEEELSEDGETVRNYDHGTVRIDSNIAKATKKYGNNLHKSAKKQPTDETVVKYKHGSVKISGKKPSVTTDDKAKSTKDKKKVTSPDEKEVTSTANEASELATKLSSTTTSADKKSFIDAYGPVVVICGIIGGLAAIVGVAGLVMDQTGSKDANLDSVLGDSEDNDVDVEANVTSAGVQDAADDSDDLLDESDSDGDDEEEGTFANGTAHVSV